MNEEHFTPRTTPFLQAFDLITTKAKRSELSDSLFDEIAEPAALLQKELGLTPGQCLLLAGIFNETDFTAGQGDLAHFFDCSNIRLLSLLGELRELEERGILLSVNRRRGFHSGNEYRLNPRFLDIITGDKSPGEWTKGSPKCETADDFFIALDNLYDLLDENLAPEKFRQMTDELLAANRHLTFVTRSVKIADEAEDETALFTLLTTASRLVNHNDEEIRFRDIEDIWRDDKHLSRRLQRELKNHTHPLFKAKVIEPGNDGGLFDNSYFHLTREAKRSLLGEFEELFGNNDGERPGHTSLILPDSIVERRLFFPSETAQRIDELARLTSEGNLAEVQRRLQDSGFRFGLGCLFYGAPGTGKTEAVLQLAKSSGRSIFKINFGVLKSAWVGESEKNVKSVFDTYRDICRKTPKTPILFFNEADALFGRRNETPERAVEKMENTIQNIILEEMETLDGILIATTNLAVSLDAAFERRFLYKVKFENPDAGAREKIWRYMLPELTDFEAEELAEGYPFTGGQIENAARLYLINKALFGESSSRLLTIRSYCDAERIS